MSWQKSSDGAATHPKLMMSVAVPGADERTLNELAGFLWRCSTQSAQHKTDYFVDLGTALMLGGARSGELIELAQRVGLMSEHLVDGLRCVKLLEDEDLWHIRSRAEQEWENTQRDDTRDPALRVPVVRRDGDNCRYCGVLTQWRGQRSKRTQTLDHRVPGEKGTVDTMVVACWGCQSSRKNNPQWDDDHPLRPVPAVPRFGKWAALYLSENGYPTAQNVYRDGDDAQMAPVDGAEPAPERVRPATDQADRVAASAPADPVGPQSAPGVESQSSQSPPGTTTRVGLAGSGSGQVGSPSGGGLVGQGTGGVGKGQPPASGRRRGRRGGRGRGRGQSSEGRGDSQ